MSEDKNDPLLQNLRGLKPSPEDLLKWKAAVQSELNVTAQSFLAGSNLVNASTSRYKFPLQIIAAMLVGFIAGALIFGSLKPSSQDPEWVEIVDADATFQHSHTNLN